MRNLIVVALYLLLAPNLAAADMLRSEAIGNEPAKEKLCAQRAKGRAVPFEIDSRYLASARRIHPDATFIAIDGMSPQLIECFLTSGTGRFEPASMSPEQGYWHLIRPQQFSPGINTPQGTTMAANVCLRAAEAKIDRADLDHSVYSTVAEITPGGPLYHPGADIAGRRADRYDIAVKGASFYKSSGPDLAAVKFTCLLSPMLDLKGLQLR